MNWVLLLIDGKDSLLISVYLKTENSDVDFKVHI